MIKTQWGSSRVLGLIISVFLSQHAIFVWQ